MVGNLDELLWQAQELANRLQNALTGASSYIARDDTGTIEITVDQRGRLTTIRLVKSWRSNIVTDEFADGVLQAIANAIEERTISWATELSVDGDSGELKKAKSYEPTISVPDFSHKEPETVLNIIREASSLFDDFDSRLQALDEQEEIVEELTQVRSPNRRVFLALEGEQPVKMDIDPNWLENADPTRICHEISIAFERAYQEIDQKTPYRLMRSTQLDPLYRIADDCRSLLKKLGFNEEFDKQ